jgi:succinate dehydrogenase/fumarate reductase-like Fe-S protein
VRFCNGRLFYADDVNLLEDNRHAIKKNTETAIGASKKVGLEVNAEKTKYMLKSYIFCDTCIMTCSTLKVNRNFGGTYRLHLQV